MRIALLLWAGAALAMAQNPLARPDPFEGTFEGDGVTLTMAPKGGDYAGTLTFQGQSYPAAMKTSGTIASGSFEVQAKAYPFTLTQQGGGFLLNSAGADYRLARKGSAAAPSAQAGSAAAGIVGTWRNAQGYARFNADGTGEMDGMPGRYEIRGNQLTLTGAQGTGTLGFELRGDVLTLMVNGAPVKLERAKADQGGSGGVRMELVGKWCWMTQTNVLNGARQSNRCLTLNGNGSYLYEGLTDSYGPNGGATGQSSDSGTWTATENTITAHSRSGKTVTYRLEKRNHPKNVRDPMIVLDGQPFVTFYNKPPW